MAIVGEHAIIGSVGARSGRSGRRTKSGKEVRMFVMDEAMRAKLDRILGATEPVKVDGRKTRTWTKAQKRAIAKRLAAGRARAKAEREAAMTK